MTGDLPDQSGYRPPPDGWQGFGYHADVANIPDLEFSTEVDDAYDPLWERHKDGSACHCKHVTDDSGSWM